MATTRDLCDFVEDPSPFAPRLVKVSADGEVSLLGVGMSVVDAGDYDADGNSEVLVKGGGYNRDGYVLFFDGCSRRVEFNWNYH